MCTEAIKQKKLIKQTKQSDISPRIVVCFALVHRKVSAHSFQPLPIVKSFSLTQTVNKWNYFYIFINFVKI
jgi:hypothetical protein